MNILERFKSQKVPPATVPTDTVVPIYEIDYLSHKTMELIMRFDDVLDPAKLQQSLRRLLEIGNWRKLGARVRVKGDPAENKYEYHIPEQYDDVRQGFIYRVSKHSGSINSHPTAARLPGHKNGTATSSSQDFGELGLQPGDPRHLVDWAYTDLPQLFFHHIAFTDATVIFMTYPHSMMDAMGHSTFLRAWMAVLHGREHEVPELSSLEDHRRPLAERTPAKNYLLYDNLLSRLGLMLFLFNRFIEDIWATKEERIVCVPGEFVRELRAQTLDELDPSKEKQFLSENDVILAWFTRTILSAAKTSGKRSLILMNWFDIRSTVLPPKVGHIFNAVIPAHTMVPISEVLKQPLAFLATQIRHSLAQQRAPEQIEAWYSMVAARLKQGLFPLVGTSNGFTTTYSSWHTSGLFRLDLSPAVTQQGLPLDQRTNKIGYPSCVFSPNCFSMLRLRNAGCCLGKDEEGNWWFQWLLRKREWKKIEEYLSQADEDTSKTSL
ncbi:hypothetical protein N7537_005367 [Penicillium hordei]|uniref:LysR family regulatory protein n=1 Tax=Penicillium hordei TaxID=40994 RepID=A0AAD6H124_9EURO|nr:uncharacterized protein N7537_005367 [Penicillium hordei]KAJ5602411.1 hypothetical protein N7537_005367 [Penicillium hordei]